MLEHNKIKHIPVIDVLRGVAALMVCLYHFVCTTTGYFSNQAVLQFFEFGKQGVQMFFVISGIVIPLSMINGKYNYQSWVSFLLKRVARIEPPYLVAVLMGIGYLTLRNYLPGTAKVDLTPSALNVLLHIGYLIPFFKGELWINPVFWTLAIEFQYYLLLSIIFPFAIRSQIWKRVLFYVVILLPCLFNIPNSFFPYWGSLFLLGIVYVLWQGNYISTKEYFLISIIAALFVFFKIGATDLIVGVSTMLVVHFASEKHSVIGLFFGKISYSIYLVHSIVGAAFVNICSHKFTQPYQKVLVVIGGLAITIFSAYLLYLLIEKPSQALSKRIQYNSKKI